MSADLPVMPDTVALKPCCQAVLVNEECDCDAVWAEFQSALAEPMVWRAVR